LLRISSFVSTSLLALMTAGAVAAQTASPQTQGEDRVKASDEVSVEEVVVTGSRVRTTYNSPTPVNVVGAERMQQLAIPDVATALNQIPSFRATVSSSTILFRVSGAIGGNTPDLRGLGVSRTLVLVDGKRQTPTTQSGTVDLNLIPTALIKGIDVVSGGGSAVYGSDALAGVVNFIMKKDFEGVQIDASYSFYQHNNDFDGVGNIRTTIASRAATNPSQFQLPDNNVIDGYGKEVTFIMGVNAPDDRGNLTAYATYRNDDAILQANRDYSACAIAVPSAALPNNFTCGGSSTSYPGRFTDFGSAANGLNATIDSATGNTFRRSRTRRTSTTTAR